MNASVGSIDRAHWANPAPQPPKVKGPGGTSVEKAARSFEAYFISSLFNEMRKTIPQGGELGSGMQMGVYQSLFDQALAEKLSQRGGIGLAAYMIRKMGGPMPAGGPKGGGAGTGRASLGKIVPNPLSFPRP